jgi:hypothetical protein
MGMNNASDATATLPRTIAKLITEVTAVGGEVNEVQPRRFDIVLPVRTVSGEVRMVTRASVGYYIRDGKNIIGGLGKARQEIAYWGKQARLSE